QVIRQKTHFFKGVLRDLHTRWMHSPTPRIGQTVVFTRRHFELQDRTLTFFHREEGRVHADMRVPHGHVGGNGSIVIHHEGGEIVTATIQDIHRISDGPGHVHHLTWIYKRGV